MSTALPASPTLGSRDTRPSPRCCMLRGSVYSPQTCRCRGAVSAEERNVRAQRSMGRVGWWGHGRRWCSQARGTHGHRRRLAVSRPGGALPNVLTRRSVSCWSVYLGGSSGSRRESIPVAHFSRASSKTASSILSVHRRDTRRYRQLPPSGNI